MNDVKLRHKDERPANSSVNGEYHLAPIKRAFAALRIFSATPLKILLLRCRLDLENVKKTAQPLYQERGMGLGSST